MKSIKVYHKEVESQLQIAMKTEKKSKFADLKKYIGTQYDFIGLSVPTQRKIFKQGYTFNNKSLEFQFQIWDQLWMETSTYEVMSQSILFFQNSLKESIKSRLSKKGSSLLASEEIHWNTLKPWVSRIDNWAHSDSLSAMYSEILEHHPTWVWPQLQTWNKSDNSWERRQSLVSLLEYSKKRKKVLAFNKMIPLVKNLLEDENYFVQKGLGWTLREIGNVYPTDTLEFLKKYSGKIHSVAFTAAIEKVNIKEKEYLKELRKVSRKN